MVHDWWPAELPDLHTFEEEKRGALLTRFSCTATFSFLTNPTRIEPGTHETCQSWKDKSKRRGSLKAQPQASTVAEPVVLINEKQTNERSWLYAELTLSGKVITMGKLKESWKTPQLYTLRMDQVIRMKNQSSEVGCLTYHVVFYFWDGIKRQKAERDRVWPHQTRLYLLIHTAKGGLSFLGNGGICQGESCLEPFTGAGWGDLGWRNSYGLGGYAGLEFLLSGSVCPRWGRLSWEAGCLNSHSSLCWLIKVEQGQL